MHRRGLRPLLPVSRPVLYSGLPVAHDVRWGDSLLSGVFRVEDSIDQPTYESSLIQGLRQHVRPGDRVLVIGGGVGVTTVVAAQCAGPAGHVECYEGGLTEVASTLRTIGRNGVSDRVSVHHAVVGKAVCVWGEGLSDVLVPPQALPECDVLELDCEGAEAAILRDMAIAPRVCLVETHGMYGAPTDLVAGLLRNRGYEVVDIAIEERNCQWCRENDMTVLAAIRA